MYKSFLFYHNTGPLIFIIFLNELYKALIINVVFRNRSDEK